jgi:hypothetical protein
MSEEQEQHWHYLSNGQQFGPLSAEQLQELAMAGTITAATLVRTEALDEWIPASNIEGLLPAAPVQAGPRLITGAAAQTAAPFASVAQAAPAPAAVQTVAQPGFSAGAAPLGQPGRFGSSALAPASEQRLQIRSVGILQAGVISAVLSAITTLLYAILILMFGGMLVAAAGDNDLMDAIVGGGMMLLVLGPIVAGMVGFLYGMVAALLYNLAAKMGGGLVIKVQAKAAW